MRKIQHLPFGIDDPYINAAYTAQRIPNDPTDGEDVIINFKTMPMEAGQRAWLEVVRNGMTHRIRAQYQYNEGKWALWKARLMPSCAAFEKIKYRIAFGQGNDSMIFSEWYSFTVKKWVEDTCLGFDGRNLFISRENDQTEIPRLIMSRFLTDGENIYDIELIFERKEGENLYGLGEHYDSLGLSAGSPYYIHVFDQYKVQQKRGYAPIPFVFSNMGFGLFLNTGFRTKVLLNKGAINVVTETLGTPISPDNFSAKLWIDTKPLEIISDIYKITSPQLPPIWAFGPWASANEWNSQNKVEQTLEKLKKFNLPTSVIVIEAWSDEQTFYIFNGAKYNPKKGSDSFSFEDFVFKFPWPDPKGMIDKLHMQGIKLVLWQIPVLKDIPNPIAQYRNDIKFAVDNGYVVSKNDQPYRIPEGRWFENSFVVDFFNKEARDWWKKKREYLVNELGIDGFKTDGGEHLWGRNTYVYPNKSAAEARNIYPEKYFESAKEIVGEDGVLFSRSGYIDSPKFTLFWVGDEDSDFEAMKSNLIAGLNVSLSGNPFWGWDIAGFSGELPEPELYRRAVQLATFTPIFQFHSEAPGDPIPSAERSPWNVSEYWGALEILNEYRELVSLRMCLVPYIYMEAKNSVLKGVPLTTPIQFKFLDLEISEESLAFMFGQAFLVIPVLEAGVKNMKVFLPKGRWVDFWTGRWYEGNTTIDIDVSANRIPAFVKENAIIPLSLPESKNILEPHWDFNVNAVLCITDDILKVRNKILKFLHEFYEVKWFGIPEREDSKNKKILSIKWLDIEEVQG
ncbi:MULTISPECIES: TIM-barrel domain-containing protein [Kosmotoga]|uniref:Glycoside hydrolase family 31 n=1 Tax=Kosmotoga olearia (strain ATCC BAA-1733 / DSM 21960 / TBF 19.5.1) TaxID=521045 RepID=C5CH55_KOSOT|nr:MULTISPECIES: TIM-barrel domain-containing protein [Kosmotoga]ACR80658.1 glycoside hydrolase family 31 [Kosmotoga olearia TBF 19.5.1]OAA19107.1 hypothetical protein DU53_10800 [Kosmotoga sp. DU53]